MKPLTFVSFFAGIGGFDLGLERAGMECVGQVEIEPFCRSVLAKHWPGVKRMDDVRVVRGDEFGRFDFLVAGFPCQDVSNAGLRAGVSAPRSGLYGQVVRCLRLARPFGALLENVAALLGRGMGTVLGDLAEIGYDAEWDCLPAGAFGALHERDRVFIAAYSVREGRSGLLHHHRRVVPTPILRRQADALAHACDTLRGFAQGVGVPLAWRSADGVADRVDRLVSIGNSVYMPVAEAIGRGIVSAMREEYAT